MNVLYVVGSCLTKNTSANMSHNAYVQGLLENGCSVDIIMAADSWGEADNALPRFEQAHYHTYNATSFADRLRQFGRKKVFRASTEQISAFASSTPISENSFRSHFSFRSTAKVLFYKIFPNDPVYPLDRAWLKSASHFKSDKYYDLVISNSSPAASHKLVVLLKNAQHINFGRWIQIWEDPWYHDLYGGHSDAIREEEHSLLRAASEIFYVSPLTAEYQKKFYPDCAEKMNCIPLPFLEFTEDTPQEENVPLSFGYFGDYYSQTRNLRPFYDALCQSGHIGYIYGDSDLSLSSTEKITVSGRVTLDKLAIVQDHTSILVHLCNLRGGQIPGKIYHYSATSKPILFILDGTPKEQKIIFQFFDAFHRYCFCENTPESILNGIQTLSQSNNLKYGSVDSFSPFSVVRKLLYSTM